MAQKITAYYHGFSVFELPEGFNIEDTNTVKDWWIKWNTLYVELVDGKKLEFEPTLCDNGTKRPDSVEIE
jgi:hypothetical protein